LFPANAEVLLYVTVARFEWSLVRQIIHSSCRQL